MDIPRPAWMSVSLWAQIHAAYMPGAGMTLKRWLTCCVILRAPRGMSPSVALGYVEDTPEGRVRYAKHYDALRLERRGPSLIDDSRRPSIELGLITHEHRDEIIANGGVEPGLEWGIDLTEP